MCAKRTSPRKHCKRRKCDAVEEGPLIRTQKMQSEQNRRTVHLNFTLSPRARTRAHKAPHSPKGIFVLLKRRKDFDENFHFFDFLKRKHTKKKIRWMSSTSHKYVRAQYERLVIALNDLSKHAESDAEKEQRSIRYAYAVRNFTTSLNELEQELKLVEEKALKKTTPNQS